MSVSPKKRTAVVAIVVIVTIGIFFFVKLNKKVPVPIVPPVVEKVISVKREVIGKSVEGREIESFTYGSGDKHLVFVGGIHGGYEWNSVLLAYKLTDYLKENPDIVPKNLTITVIPSANPDGMFKVLGKEGRFTLEEGIKAKSTPVGLGRFNAHSVDLNRNFDCKWEPEATWRSQKVSAGSKPFSEPESAALRDLALNRKPNAFVFFHSQANAVYASECEKGILPATLIIMNTYAKAAGYPSVSSFDAYPVTGDAEGWLASIGIPAITVELKTHETIEWEKNLAGIQAVFGYFKQ